MTALAERILRDIQKLPPEERRKLWQEIGTSLPQRSDSPVKEDPSLPRNVEATLKALTGCTKRQPLLARLLKRRALDRARERAQEATFRADRPSRAHGKR